VHTQGFPTATRNVFPYFSIVSRAFGRMRLPAFLLIFFQIGDESGFFYRIRLAGTSSGFLCFNKWYLGGGRGGILLLELR